VLQGAWVLHFIFTGAGQAGVQQLLVACDDPHRGEIVLQGVVVGVQCVADIALFPGRAGDVTTAVMLGALLIHDVIPSPTFISEEPVLAYAIFLAFFVATFMMLGLQSFMLRVFVLVTKVRMYILACVILGFCGIGVFAINNVEFDLWTLLWFGILGLLMRHFGFPLAPMILGVVLGNIAELNLARAFAITTDLTPFVTRPWSLLFLILAVSLSHLTFQD